MTANACNLHQSFLNSNVLARCPNVDPTNLLFYVHGKPARVSPFGTVLFEWLTHITSNKIIDIRVELRGGLLGGKGGFGAQLKALGKAGGGHKTTSFGACRDLNGRRLRHVNDALRLKIWREAREAAEAKRDLKERGGRGKGKGKGKGKGRGGVGGASKGGGEEDEAEDSFAFRDGQTRSGIEGWHLSIPSWADGVKSGKLRNTHKRKFYNDQRAATKEFDQRHEKKRARMERVDKYAEIDGNDNDRRGGEDPIMSAVLAGMGKASSSSTTTSSSTSSSTSSTSSSSIHHVDPVLTCLRGSIGVGGTGEALGESNFGSVGVPWSRLTSGKWYYEVEILTDDGVVQVGFADSFFLGDDTNGDGVGDDAHSWCYDGARGKAWHGGEDGHRDYGAQWKTGDVVGCLLDLSSGLVSFALNGKSLGVAFDSVATGKKRGVGVGRKVAYYPACSLELNQSVRMNVGQRPFKFIQATEEDGFKPVWDSRPKSDDEEGEEEEESEVEEEEADEEEEAAVKVTGAKVVVVTSSSRGGGGGGGGGGAGAGAAAAGKDGSVSKEKNGSVVVEEDVLDMDKLKVLLQKRNVKCGGTLEERKERYAAIQHLSDDEIPKKLLASSRRSRTRK